MIAALRGGNAGAVCDENALHVDSRSSKHLDRPPSPDVLRLASPDVSIYIRGVGKWISGGSGNRRKQGSVLVKAYAS